MVVGYRELSSTSELLFYILSVINKIDRSIISMQILQSFSVLFLLLSLLLLFQLPSGFPHSLKSRFLSLLLDIFFPQPIRFIKGRPTMVKLYIFSDLERDWKYFLLPSQLTKSTLEFPLSVGVGWVISGDTNTEFPGGRRLQFIKVFI